MNVNWSPLLVNLAPTSQNHKPFPMSWDTASATMFPTETGKSNTAVDNGPWESILTAGRHTVLAL